VPTEDLLKKKRHLKALEDFIASPAHEGFIIGIEEEIRQLEGLLLDMPLTDLETVFRQCGIKGQRECLYTMLDRFTGALEELKDRIAEMEDSEMKGGR
jgi:hypothetical protein